MWNRIGPSSEQGSGASSSNPLLQRTPLTASNSVTLPNAAICVSEKTGAILFPRMTNRSLILNRGPNCARSSHEPLIGDQSIAVPDELLQAGNALRRRS
jgi:hypothetical protein